MESAPLGTWSTVEVAGHTADVYEPAAPREPRCAVLYLHGVHLARLDQNQAFTREFERHGLIVVAPHTGRSWWTDKICPEFDAEVTAEQYVLRSVVPYLAERWQVAPPRIALLGTSMGGQGALRFAFKHPRTFPIAAALSPAIDYQVRFDEPEEETLPQMYPDAESVRQDTATLHVHPLNWPRNLWFATDPADYRWHESAEKLRSKLAALGIPHEYDLETSAGGHGWSYYNHMAPRALQFIAERLDQEQRRMA
jgi:S-formylglutathione hydrolase FrmB